MPTYQFLLHTSGIQLSVDNGESYARGFLTSRRAKAKSVDVAFDIVMKGYNSDPKISEIISFGYEAGLQPQTEVEETYIIPWWRTILPWKKPGLAFYEDER